LRRNFGDVYVILPHHFACQENVTQSAENRGKKAANNNEGRRKQVAGICPNLLNPLD